MEEISKQEYEEFFKWLFGKNVEIKQEIDISMAPYYADPNIYYTKEIYDLFQTEAMQRLGKITHLGAFILINKNCYHTRLEHSKGAYRRCVEFLATKYREPKWRQYIEKNKQKAYLVDIIKFMCTHDIGHSMLSHSIEKLIGNDKFTHEDVGDKIRTQDEQLRLALEKIKPDEENSNKGDGSLETLCDGNIDFDRSDYLSRDYLYFDKNNKNINEIIRKLDLSCKLEKLDNGKMVYVYDYQVLQEIKNFFLFREELYKKHYREKEKAKTEHYLRKILKRIIEDDKDSEIKNLFLKLYNKNIDEVDVQEILDTNDLKLFNLLIKLESETDSQELKSLVSTIIPGPENAFNLAVNMIDPKNRRKEQYTQDEIEFISNIKKIINGEIEHSDNITDYIIAFESDDEKICEIGKENPAIETYIKKFRIYNKDNPIYIKDKEGKIIKFENYPDLSIDLSPEYMYGVYVSIDELKNQGKSQQEISNLLDELKKYDDKDENDKTTEINELEAETNIEDGFNRFFEDR